MLNSPLHEVEQIVQLSMMVGEEQEQNLRRSARAAKMVERSNIARESGSE